MPLIQEQIVDIHGWLDMEQFTDLITISQMTPGPIAINSATFVGIRIAGISGALVASAGCILPSCVIVVLLAKLYLKYENMDVLQSVLNSLRPAVVAMIASAGISILVTAFWGNSADKDKLEPGGNFSGFFSISAKAEMESGAGHGAGGSHEAGSGSNTGTGIIPDSCLY